MTEIEKQLKKYPLLRQNSETYQSFMINLLQKLEPRHFAAKEVIYQELDNADEIYFVMKGRFDVGYLLNRTAKYRLQFGDRAIIGGFNMVYHKRIMQRYRAHKKLVCYSIRRSSWHDICEENQYLGNCLKMYFLQFYNTNIRLPLQKRYQLDLEQVQRRSDFKQLKALPDYSHMDIIKLRLETFGHIEDYRNCQHHQEQDLSQMIQEKLELYELLI